MNVKVDKGSQVIVGGVEVLYWIILVNEGPNRVILVHVQIDFQAFILKNYTCDSNQ